MKPLILALFVLGSIPLVGVAQSGETLSRKVDAIAQDAVKKPENLTMTLAWVADAEQPKQHVFVINGIVAYKTLDGLKKYLRDVPKGSSLTWAPGCCRIGNEPLLGSHEEMKKFQEFCESVGIKFTLVPAG